MKWLDGYRMRLVLVGFFAIVFLSPSSVCPAAEDTWVRKADMPTARWTLTTAVVNGKIYAIGGAMSEPDSRVLSTVEEYDPVTDVWTRKADMPTARGWLAPSSPVVDGKIYVIGGGDDLVWDLPTVEMYDPITDTWTRKADMLKPRWNLATCAVNGKIYAIGGAPASYSGLKNVEVYDPSTDTWTRIANMPTGRWGLCANVVDGKIYTIGGTPDIVAGSHVEVYDPDTDTWTIKDGISATRNMGSCVLYRRIYVFGGWITSGGVPFSRVEEYDPARNIRTLKENMPEVRAALSTCVVGGKIYAIGGTPRNHPCRATSTVYEFTVNISAPSSDFNGDGIVDSADFCIMLDCWHTDDPLCDIAPTPSGDGIVDIQDMVFLSEFIGMEVDDPTLIAYWKLDEIDGSSAHDSSGENHGIVHGNAAWQSDGGMIKGALLLDGINDYVETPAVPDTSELSIFAWVKGGARSEVVLSQACPTNWDLEWLLADPATGALASDIKVALFRKTLTSDVVITDGEWHRVGLAWDGSERILYVDDIEVARDSQTTLAPAADGLQIGTGSKRARTSFWSGLIDDVRIYNRAVSPAQ